MNPLVDSFLAHETQWKEEFTQLRRIILEQPLVEEIKWGQPCYTLDGKNVVLIHGFKEYCAILFIKGSLLTDSKGIMIQQTGQVQAGRQVRFAKVDEILALEPTLKEYILQAMALEKSGARVPMKKTEDFPVAEEFQTRLDADQALKAAFEALTPGRQRAWLLHFAQPKQSATRSARVEKAIPLIMEGIGLNDR